MSTTFEQNRTAKRGNYCTLPTIDVEILPERHHCATCGEPIVWDRTASTFGAWIHTTPPTEPADGHYVTARASCRYCHAEDGVTSKQHAWHDSTDCARCGGSYGYAIGD